MDTKIVIIGAGVVGLAIAERLSRLYEGVFVVEQHKRFGQETSSRNSEVIHSGIYYPEGSLKALLCVRGRDMLYGYCRDKEVLHRRCGKYMVATDQRESQELEGVLNQARKNGVDSGRVLDRDTLKQHEPNVEGVRALYFDTSGIVDTHGLMKQLETDAVIQGAQVAYESRVTGLRRIEAGYEVVVEDASGTFVFTSEAVVNSGGLEAYNISCMLGIDDPRYRLHFWKGQYWSIGNGKHKMISSLIYPVPQARLTGLGVHATVDLNGGVKLGPDAVYLEDDEWDYTVAPASGKAFYEAARRFLPFLEPDDLHPDQAGIRPKLQKPGDPVRDFIIREEKERGYPRFINLVGIESPGLTASLAIGEYVAGLLK